MPAVSCQAGEVDFDLRRAGVGAAALACVFSLQRLQSGQGEKGQESCEALCELCFGNNSLAN